MSLIARLLSGLSSFALLMGAGAGLQGAAASTGGVPVLQEGASTQSKPLAEMSLDELAAFVAQNADVGLPSAQEAAAQFGDRLALLIPKGVLDEATKTAADNAFMLLLQHLNEGYGAFDEGVVVADAGWWFLRRVQLAGNNGSSNGNNFVAGSGGFSAGNGSVGVSTDSATAKIENGTISVDTDSASIRVGPDGISVNVY